MTAKEVFELRKQGHKEQAYEAARRLYAVDKSPYASSAMFWTAVDKLRMLVDDGCLDDARKVFLALERLLPSVPDRDGWVNDAFRKCSDLLKNGDTLQCFQGSGPEHLLTGSWGEEVAADYLRGKGYVILERNWHSGHRDIDIIAQHDGCIVFVEVKTRRSADFGSPLVAVNYNKRQNLQRAINHYIHYRHLDMPCRFDVVSIVGIPGQSPVIEHIEDFQL